MFEEILPNGDKKPLYVGQTNNIKRRVSEHLRGEDQEIDRELATLDPNKIAVKYERKGASHAKYNEHKYIQCIEKNMGTPLPFNKIKGISMKENRKRGTGKANGKKNKTAKIKKSSMKAKNRK